METTFIVEEEAAAIPLDYTSLHSNVEAVFKRAQDGVKTCKAMTLLLQQTSTLEDQYGASIIKVCSR